MLGTWSHLFRYALRRPSTWLGLTGLALLWPVWQIFAPFSIATIWSSSSGQLEFIVFVSAIYGALCACAALRSLAPAVWLGTGLERWVLEVAVLIAVTASFVTAASLLPFLMQVLAGAIPAAWLPAIAWTVLHVVAEAWLALAATRTFGSAVLFVLACAWILPSLWTLHPFPAFQLADALDSARYLRPPSPRPFALADTAPTIALYAAAILLRWKPVRAA